MYPRPDGSIYICGIGGSEYVHKDDLRLGRFRDVCEANESRVAAATSSFQEMSSLYKNVGELDKTQSCMRPCPPDALPYMGRIPGYEGAFVNAGHNCWYVHHTGQNRFTPSDSSSKLVCPLVLEPHVYCS